MSYIGNNLQVAYPSYTNIDDISGSFNGVTTSFALTVGGVAPVPAPLSSNQCMISVGGVIQRPDDTGTEGFRLSGGNIVFSSAPNTGEDFFGVILAGADYVNVGVNYPSGTASTPSITFDTDLDTGLYNPAANELGITTAGTSRLVVDSSGNVNIDSNTLYVDAVNNRVGVGTTSPLVDFEVQSASNTTIRIDNEDDSTAQLYFHNTGSIDMDISVSSANMTFNHGASERMRIDSSGRLLVGTSSSTNVNTRAVFQGYGSSANEYAIVCLKRGDDPAVAGSGLGLLSFGDKDADSVASIGAFRDTGTWTHDVSEPTRLVFSTTADGDSSPTPRLHIKSQGEIVFGATGLTTAPTMYFNPDGGGGYFYKKTNSANTRNAFIFENPNGVVGSITTTGSATAYNTSSDYRLKENVAPVTDGITRLQQLKPSRFNFIADPDTTVDGFLAHEVQAIVPEAITGEKDAVDDEGNPQYQGIDQSKLVPLLTAALQEAISEIESLKARVVALETP